MESKLPDIKIQLHALCLEILEERIKEARVAIEEIQLAANEETKSSAGDKYETGRAMLQQEQDKYGRQLSETLKHKAVFDQLKPEVILDKVQTGSLIFTNAGLFYIATSLGAVKLHGKEYMVISSAAPLFQHLSGLVEGEEVLFNTRKFRIEAVV